MRKNAATIAWSVPALAVTPAPGEKLAANQTYTFWLLDAIKTTDPHKNSDVEGSDVIRQLFEGLLNEDAKGAIGRACAAQIPDNSSVILNIGTTTEAVAQALLHHSNIMVVTNNMNVANILLANPGCEIMVAGGALRRSDGGLTGELTTQFFEQFKVDFAVIGSSALDADGDLLDFDLAEVRVSRAILRQARRSFLVTDHSKIGRPAPARIASLSEMDSLFTDLPLPSDLARRCAEWNTRVHICAPPAVG